MLETFRNSNKRKLLTRELTARYDRKKNEINRIYQLEAESF